MKNLIAFCYGTKCTGRETYKPVQKNVRQGTLDCPDCKYTLRWVKDKNAARNNATRKIKHKLDNFVA